MIRKTEKKIRFNVSYKIGVFRASLFSVAFQFLTKVTKMSQYNRLLILFVVISVTNKAIALIVAVFLQNT